MATSRTSANAGEPTALRVYRHFRGMSQEELAAKSGVAEATISRLERRKNTPSLETAARIADALNLPVDLIFSDSGRAAPR